MKGIISKIKSYFYWFIMGLILFYLVKTGQDHWEKIKIIELELSDYSILCGAFLVTFLAHIWAGIVWFLILKQTFAQKLNFSWTLQIYLITNIAKYIPGNIWHFYGRINSIYQQGCTLGIASLSVLIEPLLMAVSALSISLIGHSIGIVSINKNSNLLFLEILILCFSLSAFHPQIINPIIHYLSKLKFKNKQQKQATDQTYLHQYPLIPLMGEFIFLMMRSLGFLLILLTFIPLNLTQIPLLISAFSFAWLLGLIIPGAPGGLGIFEATIIALLHEQLPSEIIIITAAIFRVISILAEATGAGLAYLPKFLYPSQS